MRTMKTIVLAACLTPSLVAFAADEAAAPADPQYAGQTANGFLLPNGWRLTPVGRHVALTDLPLNILPLADGRHALVATSGYNVHELSVVDLEAGSVVDKERVTQSWFGLALSAANDRIWWAGGGSNKVYTYALAGKDLRRLGAATQDAEGQEPTFEHDFKSGLAIDARRGVIYSLDIDAGAISALDLDEGKQLRSGVIGGRPYDVALSRNGAQLYVSDWAGRRVLVLDPENFRVLDKIGVGDHPNQLAQHPSDGRLFVACASSNSVSVIDTGRGAVMETVVTTLFPQAPEGSTPDALAIAPDGKTLYVANADNNCVALIDIRQAGRSNVKGFIPTGWYPVSVAVSPDGRRLLVGVGKGLGTKPNPPFPKELTEKEKTAKAEERRQLPFPYIGTTLSGALTIIDLPEPKPADDEEAGDEREEDDDADDDKPENAEREADEHEEEDEDEDPAAAQWLAKHTERVYRNCPYSDKLLTAAAWSEPSPIPTRVGDPSPIKHVIYIIKENRTYDQVFGDMPRGNGDPELCLFGEEITPNHHKLASEFVLLDNLYCNGQVSRDGHPWSTQAYNTDYIARDWALTYSGREGVDDDDERSLSTGPSGHIWDACARAGLVYRNYGEYGRRVSQPDGSMKMESAVPGLVGHICPEYGIPKVPGAELRDTENVEVFLKEFEQYCASDSLPHLIVMSLGEDHTRGTRPGSYTPQASVASNDLALGRLVEAVSHSKYWDKLAIFVIEDDAQNGPDHVDAHRTIGLVVSPYTKRNHLDSTQYTTVSMLRTIELILGLPPLSQYDAAATPMFASFTPTADPAPYGSVPARIDVNAKNEAIAYGAERSSKMDFSEYDRIDDFELNEILWFAIKGPSAPQPPYVRRAIAYRGYRGN